MLKRSKPSSSFRDSWTFKFMNLSLVMLFGTWSGSLEMSSIISTIVSMSFTPNSSPRLLFGSASMARIEPAPSSLSALITKDAKVVFPVPPLPAIAIMLLIFSRSETSQGPYAGKINSKHTRPCTRSPC